MGQEIEYKYLVVTDDWREGARGQLLRQGYLNRGPQRTVRIRIAGEAAYLTIKSLRTGIVRDEFEYSIPVADAEQLLSMCLPPLIEKRRYEVEYRGHTWEVDEFLGDNAGLIVAELEVPSVETPFELPPWVGRDVSEDPRYFNSQLAETPYNTWLDRDSS